MIGRLRGVLANPWFFIALLFFGIAWHADWKRFPSGFQSQPGPGAFWDYPTELESLSADQFVELFRGLVFYSEFGTERPYLVRWEQSEISYTIIGDADASLRRSTREFLVELSWLTSRSFVPVEDADEANAVIVFSDLNRLVEPEGHLDTLDWPNSEEVREFAKQAFCLVHIYHRGSATYRQPPSGTYTRALVFIGTDLPKYLREDCVIEELAQMMGPINDLDGFRSIFSKNVHVPVLTEIDQALLRALYSERLEAGLPRETALARVRQWFLDERSLNQSRAGAVDDGR